VFVGLDPTRAHCSRTAGDREPKFDQGIEDTTRRLLELLAAPGEPRSLVDVKVDRSKRAPIYDEVLFTV
jgi:hypothetical protein